MQVHPANQDSVKPLFAEYVKRELKNTSKGGDNLLGGKFGSMFKEH